MAAARTEDLLAEILRVLQRLEARLEQLYEASKVIRDRGKPVQSGPTSGQGG